MGGWAELTRTAQATTRAESLTDTQGSTVTVGLFSCTAQVQMPGGLVLWSLKGCDCFQITDYDQFQPPDRRAGGVSILAHLDQKPVKWLGQRPWRPGGHEGWVSIVMLQVAEPEPAQGMLKWKPFPAEESGEQSLSQRQTGGPSVTPRLSHEGGRVHKTEIPQRLSAKH